MTPFRALGLIVMFVVVSMSAVYRMNTGLPGGPKSAVPLAAEEEEDRDDPVVDALCLKGLMYLSDEKYDKAIAAYTEAIKRDPKYSFSYLGRGDAYLAKGDTDRALLDYEHATRLDPKNDAAKERVDVVRGLRDQK